MHNLVLNPSLRFCVNHRPDLLCLAESFIDFQVVTSSFWCSLGLHLITMNDIGYLLPSIWVFTALSIEKSILGCSDDHQMTI